MRCKFSVDKEEERDLSLYKYESEDGKLLKKKFAQDAYYFGKFKFQLNYNELLTAIFTASRGLQKKINQIV